MPSYDVIIIGAGPGGYVCAIRCAQLGLKTAVVEGREALGGTCLNVGCIPSKALLHAARVIDEAAHASDLGITFPSPSIDLDKLRAYKDKVVGQLTGGLAGMSKQRKVTRVTGTGRFVSPNEIEVQGDAGIQLIRFEQCIIAAGSQPVKLPAFPWDDPRVMDSTDALMLADVPKSLLVVGGGIIGLEIHVTGPVRDLHSGHFGGNVCNGRVCPESSRLLRRQGWPNGAKVGRSYSWNQMVY